MLYDATRKVSEAAIENSGYAKGLGGKKWEKKK